MEKMQTPGAGNGIGPDGSISICGSGGVRGLNSRQIRLYWGYALGGVDWMTRQELAESIPPAYTEFIGRQVRKKIKLHLTRCKKRSKVRKTENTMTETTIDIVNEIRKVENDVSKEFDMLIREGWPPTNATAQEAKQRVKDRRNRGTMKIK